MLRNVWLAAAALAGCSSVEDVRQQPVAWSASYAVPFDTMANCLATQWLGNYRVVPSVYARERRADVTIAASSVIAEYQIEQTVGDTAEVKWRHMYSTPSALRPVDRLARERADRCAAAAQR